jgi:glutathione S-transferase
MKHNITLYGVDFARSARCRWTLRELGLPFEEINDGSLIGGEVLRALQPQAKVPAIVIDGEPLFESSAICTYLCDLVPDNHLIAAAGTRARALHDQWVSFSQSEIEGYLWSNAKHQSFYPEEKRIPAVIECNNEEIARGLAVLDKVLGTSEFLIDDRFGVTDVIVGWTLNWARRQGRLDGFDHLGAYVRRLLARELCALNPA